MEPKSSVPNQSRCYPDKYAVVFLQGGQNPKFCRIQPLSYLPSEQFAAQRTGLDAALSKPQVTLQARGRNHITLELRIRQNSILPAPCRNARQMHYVSLHVLRLVQEAAPLSPCLWHGYCYIVTVILPPPPVSGPNLSEIFLRLTNSGSKSLKWSALTGVPACLPPWILKSL